MITSELACKCVVDGDCCMCNYSVGPVSNELPQTITDMAQRSQDKCITFCLEFLVIH
jgi:hypothetical protein